MILVPPRSTPTAQLFFAGTLHPRTKIFQTPGTKSQTNANFQIPNDQNKRLPLGDVKSSGSSPNSLIEYSIKTWQGLGRKVRLRRKHRRDVVFYTPLLAFRKAQRGREKIRIEEIIKHPRPSQEEIRALGLQAI
jgi:hypothetical protein